MTEEQRERKKVYRHRDDVKAADREYQQEYRERHKAAAKEYQQEYRERHKAATKEYREKNRDRIIACKKEYRENNKDRIKARRKEYSRRSGVRLANALRARVRKILKGYKSAPSLCFVGIADKANPLEFLWQYLEKQFKPGMTRENHGKWHVDHIRPCASFDLIDPQQQRDCFHYSNLQPLWASENISKGVKDYEDWLVEKKSA